MCATLHNFAHETAGAARTRSSLRPLIWGQGNLIANLGRKAPRDRQRMPGDRHCERSEAIQLLSLRGKAGLLRCARNDEHTPLAVITRACG